MTEAQENPGGGTPFGTFTYNDQTGNIQSIEIQYKIGDQWMPPRPPPVPVVNGQATQNPGYQNVTQTQISLNNGRNWIQGNAKTFVTSAQGSTTTDGTTVVDN